MRIGAATVGHVKRAHFPSAYEQTDLRCKRKLGEQIFHLRSSTTTAKSCIGGEADRLGAYRLHWTEVLQHMNKRIFAPCKRKLGEEIFHLRSSTTTAKSCIGGEADRLGAYRLHWTEGWSRPQDHQGRL